MTTTTLLPYIAKNESSTVARAMPYAPARPAAIANRPRYAEARVIPATRPADAVETIRLPSFAPLIGSQLAPLALIADDDVEIRKCMRLVLEISGYRVEEAGRGMQVLASLHHNPAVVLLDINMPGLNGVECLMEIHKRRPGMKVIVVSGQLGVEDRFIAGMGAFQFIPKPVDVHVLLAAVRRATENHSCAESGSLTTAA